MPQKMKGGYNMKNQYTIEQIRRLVAYCVWELRKAYAEKEKTEFRYRMQHLGGYFVLGFISEAAYHRAVQMAYEMI
jgi:hypothetical protein